MGLAQMGKQEIDSKDIPLLDGCDFICVHSGQALGVFRDKQAITAPAVNSNKRVWEQKRKLVY